MTTRCMLIDATREHVLIFLIIIIIISDALLLTLSYG